MADEIITGRNMPSSHRAIQGPDAADILENKLTQMQSLLSCCYGDWSEWFDGIGERHRDHIMWLAADLTDDIIGLTQEVLKRLIALEQPKA
jgi:hypothetical protein